MASELIYTSAPKGLISGSRGFCTVAFTEGMPTTYVELAESLSGYRNVYQPQDPDYTRNPVAFSHYQFVVGGERLSVLSRVCSHGTDYSGRTNKLAHHVMVRREEMCAAGPGAVMSQPGFFVSEWKDEPHLFKTSKRIGAEESSSCRAAAWEGLTGDAGWAGFLAGAFQDSPQKPAYLVFSPGMDLLPLLRESTSLLPTQTRWDVTFSTYFTTLPRSSSCVWRCCLPDSEALREARRIPGTLVIDLTKATGRAPDSGPLVSSARSGTRQQEATKKPEPASDVKQKQATVTTRQVQTPPNRGLPPSAPEKARISVDWGKAMKPQYPSAPVEGTRKTLTPHKIPIGFGAGVVLMAITLVVILSVPSMDPRNGESRQYVEPPPEMPTPNLVPDSRADGSESTTNDTAERQNLRPPVEEIKETKPTNGVPPEIVIEKDPIDPAKIRQETWSHASLGVDIDPSDKVHSFELKLDSGWLTNEYEIYNGFNTTTKLTPKPKKDALSGEAVSVNYRYLDIDVNVVPEGDNAVVSLGQNDKVDFLWVPGTGSHSNVLMMLNMLSWKAKDFGETEKGYAVYLLPETVPEIARHTFLVETALLSSQIQYTDARKHPQIQKAEAHLAYETNGTATLYLDIDKAGRDRLEQAVNLPPLWKNRVDYKNKAMAYYDEKMGSVNALKLIRGNIYTEAKVKIQLEEFRHWIVEVYVDGIENADEADDYRGGAVSNLQKVVAITWAKFQKAETKRKNDNNTYSGHKQFDEVRGLAEKAAKGDSKAIGAFLKLVTGPQQAFLEDLDWKELFTKDSFDMLEIIDPPFPPLPKSLTVPVKKPFRPPKVSICWKDMKKQRAPIIIVDITIP